MPTRNLFSSQLENKFLFFPVGMPTGKKNKFIFQLKIFFLVISSAMSFFPCFTKGYKILAQVNRFYELGKNIVRKVTRSY